MPQVSTWGNGPRRLDLPAPNGLPYSARDLGDQSESFRREGLTSPTLIIEGGRPLQGTVRVGGSKNAAGSAPAPPPGRAPVRPPRLFLDYPSVMGTMNLIFAAVLAEGRTSLINAAAEPEIMSVIDMLTAMGAKIVRSGHGALEIEGVAELGGG